MTRYCQFCKRLLARVGGDGKLEITVAYVPYAGKVYCVDPCMEKVRVIARRTGGAL